MRCRSLKRASPHKVRTNAKRASLQGSNPSRVTFNPEPDLAPRSKPSSSEVQSHASFKGSREIGLASPLCFYSAVFSSPQRKQGKVVRDREHDRAYWEGEAPAEPLSRRGHARRFFVARVRVNEEVVAGRHCYEYQHVALESCKKAFAESWYKPCSASASSCFAGVLLARKDFIPLEWALALNPENQRSNRAFSEVSPDFS